MHVVQIWIMHINALKTQLMHKNVQTNTEKWQKNWHNTHVVLCWHEKIFESNKRQWISFRPQRWGVPYQNHLACCEKLWFVRSIYPNLPQMGQKNYHDMLMLLHDSMPSFMNFRRVLDYYNLKTRYLNACGRVTLAGCLTLIPIYCMTRKHATKDTDLNFQPIYMHWSMCM